MAEGITLIDCDWPGGRLLAYLATGHQVRTFAARVRSSGAGAKAAEAAA